jgi:hypothetical protein
MQQLLQSKRGSVKEEFCEGSFVVPPNGVELMRYSEDAMMMRAGE